MPFNVGLPEMLIILIIALIIFGPRKLPEIGGAVGKAMREFRKASSELTSELTREVEVEKAQERRRAEPPAPAPAPYVPEQTQARSQEPLSESTTPLLGPPQGSPPAQSQGGQGRLVETPASRPKEA